MATNIEGLISLDDIKDSLSITDASKDGLLTRLTLGAIDYVRRRTRRQLSTGVESRLFHGTDKGYILVDDFQYGSLTRVAFLNPDRSAWKVLSTGEVTQLRWRNDLPASYRIEIINAVSENPYRTLGPSPYIFPRGVSNIEITANWGTWPTFPAGLGNLIIDLVGSKYSRRVGNIRSMSVGGESLSFSDSDLTIEQKGMLDEYKRPYVEIYPE